MTGDYGVGSRFYNLARINAQTGVIAIWMGNTNAVGKQSWVNYQVSVDEIEKKTGYNLLSNVPESVQKVIEVRVDQMAL